MRAPHYPQDTPAVTRATAGPRLSVLLVEDDRADALLVEELIADAALDIEFAWTPSISDAERELTRNRPDCVLLDLNLPDANGIDALERIGKSDPAIPIVVLTGLNDEHFGISAVASGAQDYLVKGRVEPETLPALTALCDRAEARRADGGRIACQPNPGGRECPARAWPPALATAARQPERRHHHAVPAEPRVRLAGRRFLRRRADPGQDCARHDR